MGSRYPSRTLQIPNKFLTLIHKLRSKRRKIITGSVNETKNKIIRLQRCTIQSIIYRHDEKYQCWLSDKIIEINIS